MCGALRAGLIVVNTNPLYTKTEVRASAEGLGGRGARGAREFRRDRTAGIATTSVRHVIVTGVGDLLAFPKSVMVNFVLRHVQRKVPRWIIETAHSLKTILRRAADSLAPVSLGHDDLAYLQYTGGTTGVAKGAMLTHGNMVANVLQSRAWFQQVALDNATFVCALPLYHIFSLTANCLLFASLGGAGLLIANPRDFKGFVEGAARATHQCSSWA